MVAMSSRLYISIHVIRNLEESDTLSHYTIHHPSWKVNYVGHILRENNLTEPLHKIITFQIMYALEAMIKS